MTALTDIAPTGTAPYMRVYRLIRDGVVDAGPPPGCGGRGYRLSEWELLVAQTVLALRDLPDAAHPVAECIRQRPVAPSGEWLVVAADGTVRRFEHLCLDDLTPFNAARVVRLTSANAADSGVGAASVALGAVEPDPSHTGFPRLGGSNNEGGA